MSKPSSSLFRETIGEKRKKVTETYSDSQKTRARIYNATQNHRHVVLWAQITASKLEAVSKRQRDKFNTASVVYDESTGKYFYGRNNGIEKSGAKKNPVLFGDDKHEGILPKESLNNYKVGNCAEVDAINNALNAGAKLENLHLSTIHTTTDSMGKTKQACKNCTYSFKGKVKRNYTGWYAEE